MVYKRGEGWVYEMHETVTGRVGRYMVTLTLRKPTVGESYFTDTTDLESTLKALQSSPETWGFYRDDPGDYLPRAGVNTIYGTRVVTWTPIKD